MFRLGGSAEEKAFQYLDKAMMDLVAQRRGLHPNLDIYCSCNMLLYADQDADADKKRLWADFLYEVGAINKAESDQLTSTVTPVEHKNDIANLEEMTDPIALPKEIKGFVDFADMLTPGQMLEHFKKKFVYFRESMEQDAFADKKFRKSCMAEFILLSQAILDKVTEHQASASSSKFHLIQSVMSVQQN